MRGTSVHGIGGRCEHRPDPHGVCAGIVAKQALKFFAAKAVPNLDVTPAMLAACGEMLEAAVRVRDAHEAGVGCFLVRRINIGVRDGHTGEAVGARGAAERAGGLGPFPQLPAQGPAALSRNVQGLHEPCTVQKTLAPRSYRAVWDG